VPAVPLVEPGVVVEPGAPRGEEAVGPAGKDDKSVIVKDLKESVPPVLRLDVPVGPPGVVVLKAGKGAERLELPGPGGEVPVRPVGPTVPLPGTGNGGDAVGLEVGGKVIRQGPVMLPETQTLGRLPVEPAVGKPPVPVVFVVEYVVDVGIAAEHGHVIKPQVQSGTELVRLRFSGVEVGPVMIEQGPVMLPAEHRDVTVGAEVGVKTHGPTMEPNVQTERVVEGLPVGEAVGPPLGTVALAIGNGADGPPGAAGLEVRHGPAIVPPVQTGRVLVNVPLGVGVEVVLAFGQVLEGNTIHGSVTETPLQAGTVRGAVGVVPAVPDTGTVPLPAEILGANEGVAIHGVIILPFVQ